MGLRLDLVSAGGYGGFGALLSRAEMSGLGWI